MLRQYRFFSTLAALLVGGCHAILDTAGSAGSDGRETSAFHRPASINVIGNGFQQAGDLCREIGESAETVHYLDSRAIFVGCPAIAGRCSSRISVRGLPAPAFPVVVYRQDDETVVVIGPERYQIDDALIHGG